MNVPVTTSRPRRQRGVALIELVLVIAVAGALGVVIVGTLYQLNRTVDYGAGKTDVVTSVQASNRWMTRDIRKAASTDLADGASGIQTGRFDWDNAGTPVSCTYQLTGPNLTRTCGGVTHIVARGASNLTFDRTGTLVTAQFTVTSPAHPEVAETVEFNVSMRGG